VVVFLVEKVVIADLHPRIAESWMQRLHRR
jgi:hypothetical protein